MKLTKEELIERILEQPTYRPDSGLYVQVARGLRRLSYQTLSQLNHIVSLRDPSVPISGVTHG